MPTIQAEPTVLSSRKAGLPQGITLVAAPWVSIFASAPLLGPVLPRMTEHFRSQPHVDVLIALVTTLPALMVALLSIPFGMLADRAGHRRLMWWACLFYGAAGVLPYWLESLTSIVISRTLVGIAEAAVMTCSAALMGCYFDGFQRDRWYALQSGTGPIAALAAVLLGGMLGQESWHAPFLVYGFGFVLFILVATLLWEPMHNGDIVQKTVAGTEMNWPHVLRICATAVFAMSAFLVTVIQFGFLMTERGVGSPQSIGIWQGLSSLANPVGALLFGLLRARHIVKAALSFALMTAGFAVIGLLPSWQAVIMGSLIANVGCGMILPTLMTWAVSDLPAGARGKGVGVWMCAAFLGQFASPLAILWLKSLTGSLSHAVFCYAVASAIASAGAASGFRRAAIVRT